MLIALSGLPGTGKTTIARQLARDLAAVYLRIDSIEQSLRTAGWTVEGEGYTVAYAIAERDYHTWDSERIVIDTSRLSLEQGVRTILAKVATERGLAANQPPKSPSS